MFDRRVFGEIIAAGYSVEILTETLDQILDLIRQNLVCNLREEDAEELKDVLVVERRSLIKQDSIYILQEAVTERTDLIKRRSSSQSYLSTRREMAVVRVLLSMLREL